MIERTCIGAEIRGNGDSKEVKETERKDKAKQGRRWNWLQEAGSEIVRVCGWINVRTLHKVLHKHRACSTLLCLFVTEKHKRTKLCAQYAAQNFAGTQMCGTNACAMRKKEKGAQRLGKREIAFGTDDALKTKRKLQNWI